jgi:predicted N-formylglutamate amidohydrolase
VGVLLERIRAEKAKHEYNGQKGSLGLNDKKRTTHIASSVPVLTAPRKICYRLKRIPY